jgi:hypothetical protein
MTTVAPQRHTYPISLAVGHTAPEVPTTSSMAQRRTAALAASSAIAGPLASQGLLVGEVNLRL